MSFGDMRNDGTFDANLSQERNSVLQQFFVVLSERCKRATGDPPVCFFAHSGPFSVLLTHIPATRVQSVWTIIRRLEYAYVILEC